MRRVQFDCSEPNFIGGWYLDLPDLCQGLIDFFEQNRMLHKPGHIESGVDPATKKSNDLTITPKDLEQPSHAIVREYINALFACYEDYRQQWPFLAGMLTDLDIGRFVIMRYDPGGHFGTVHSERTSLGSAHRLLAWMTYLNDVDDGGQTNFFHYGLDIKPERGKTLIWPAEWTHAHSGKVVNSGTKYIVTGWMHFPVRA